jgi:hypothetical protein
VDKEILMQALVTNRDNVIKHHVVSVPSTIKVAKVEILTFRGAPAFLGTRLAKLYFDNNKSIILYSKMSGVVNRILVNNDDMVSCGQRLFELRNTNISRTKAGHKMKPSTLPIPKPFGNFFGAKKNHNQEEIYLFPAKIPLLLRNKP